MTQFHGDLLQWEHLKVVTLYLKSLPTTLNYKGSVQLVSFGFPDSISSYGFLTYRRNTCWPFYASPDPSISFTSKLILLRQLPLATLFIIPTTGLEPETTTNTSIVTKERL